VQEITLLTGSNISAKSIWHTTVVSNYLGAYYFYIMFDRQARLPLDVMYGTFKTSSTVTKITCKHIKEAARSPTLTPEGVV